MAQPLCACIPHLSNGDNSTALPCRGMLRHYDNGNCISSKIGRWFTELGPRRVFSIFPHRSCFLDLSSFLLVFSGLSPICSHPSCNVVPRTGQ
uniref:Uncharacterized protein n=1 Tax=Chelonoidis abingdonii TaxID=106734 RepID=A0A8C0J6R3_CHEAB